jgi:hypothetical protein
MDLDTLVNDAIAVVESTMADAHAAALDEDWNSLPAAVDGDSDPLLFPDTETVAVAEPEALEYPLSAEAPTPVAEPELDGESLATPEDEPEPELAQETGAVAEYEPAHLSQVQPDASELPEAAAEPSALPLPVPTGLPVSLPAPLPAPTAPTAIAGTLPPPTTLPVEGLQPPPAALPDPAAAAQPEATAMSTPMGYAAAGHEAARGFNWGEEDSSNPDDDVLSGRAKASKADGNRRLRVMLLVLVMTAVMAVAYLGAQTFIFADEGTNGKSAVVEPGQTQKKDPTAAGTQSAPASDAGTTPAGTASTAPAGTDANGAPATTSEAEAEAPATGETAPAAGTKLKDDASDTDATSTSGAADPFAPKG